MTSRAALTAVAVTLLGVGLWAWSAGLNGPYQFDDHTTPVGDPASQSLSAWRENLTRTLRPLTKLTYALEAETTMTSEPRFRRAVSLVMLCVSAALFHLLIRRLVPALPALWSVLIAAVWFLHPVHADSVLLVSGRTALLSGLFVVAALLALDRSSRWWAAVFLALACLARETAIAALLPLAMRSAAGPRRRWQEIGRELGPSLAVGALACIWIITTPRYLHLADYSFLGRPFWPSVFSQVGAVPVGVALLVQPSRLSIDYGIPLPKGFTDPLFLAGLLFYLIAGTGVLLLRRRSRAAAVGLALWLAALAPTQSVVPKLDALANRPLSLALAGLLLVAAALVDVVWRRYGRELQTPSRRALARRLASAAAVSAAIAIVAGLTMATARRAGLFQTEIGLWQDAAAKSRINPRPHVQYAELLIEGGRYREAQVAVAAAARIDPLSHQVDNLSRVIRLKEDRR